MLRAVAGHHNPSLKRARRLQKRKYRAERGYFVAEGWDVLEAALGAGVLPVEVLVRTDLAARLPTALVEAARTDVVDVVVCPVETLAEVSMLGGAADVIAVFAERRSALRDWDVLSGVTVYLYEIGDPGNVGTLVRGAVAFGASGVACSPRTADSFGPRALRAGMGAQFLIPVTDEVTPADLVAHVRSRTAQSEEGGPGPLLIFADPRGDTPSYALAELFCRRTATLSRAASAAEPEREGSRPAQGAVLVLGSERGELPAVEDEVWSGKLRAAVPQVRFDSLNVAMAGSILLYELCRARGVSGAGCTPCGRKL